MVLRIVFAGGPGCGKSSSLEPAKEAIGSAGVRCELVAEAATDLMADGLDRDVVGDFEFQRRIFEQEIANEDAAVKKVADAGGGAVIFDRGTLDAFMYLSESEACRLISEHGFTKEDLYKRYDLVLMFHGPGEGGQIDAADNNRYRMEKTPSERRLLAEAAVRAWSAHPDIRHIGWEEDREVKCKKVAECIKEEIVRLRR